MDNKRSEVFDYLRDTNCNVKFSTRWVDGKTVHDDYVVIHEAPPRVITDIVQKFRLVSLHEGVGLLIPTRL